ncbi:MAG: winged helix-turn-helix domain-containing protein [Actinomycetota bacterium]|nr:winged helix-turn-helix domain-containing protein [Actinomycetota bacterium]
MNNDSDPADARAGFSPGFDAVAGHRFPIRHAGIAVYIGLDDATAAAAGTDVRRVAEVLASVVEQVAPGAEHEITVVPAPIGSPDSNLDIVRRSGATGAGPAGPPPRPRDPAAARSAPVRRLRPRSAAVVIDISRHRITVDDRPITVTFTEFELLRALVESNGEALSRDKLLSRLPGDGHSRSARAVDDVVRRLRSKLEPHDDVIRTVRGVGYRFHPHDGVEVRHDGRSAAPTRGGTPSR